MKSQMKPWCRAVIATAVLSVLAACSSSPTSPEPRRVAHIAQPTVAAQPDDLPPDEPCASGWTEIEGKWVCENGI